MNLLTPEGWVEPQKILVMLAHPDDPEFFLGATIARWTRAGHHVHYCLLTRGDKGAQDPNISGEDLARLRVAEQNKAAAALGVEVVRFLEHEDGTLIPNLEIRREVVKVIREEKPDILVTCDPTNYFPHDGYINHPDHRAAGQIVIDSYFPASGSPMFYPDLALEGLTPHSVKEIWMSLTHQPNVVLDISDTWQQKITALHYHCSQIGDPDKFDERMATRHTPDSTPNAPRFEEKFHRIIYG